MHSRALKHVSVLLSLGSVLNAGPHNLPRTQLRFRHSKITVPALNFQSFARLFHKALRRRAVCRRGTTQKGTLRLFLSNVPHLFLQRSTC